ncbi:MAG: ParB/RepB/Spo0J family partition protein [Alphaproteobacteria bacterium]|nr:ParB/RepB/Spo0J family partition protein [Alphaproteobacteria bacterium]
MSRAGKGAGSALIEHLEDWRTRNPAAAAGASHLDPSTARQRSTWPIGLDQIHVGPRLREVDEAVVERLAESMDRIGLQNPIQVRHNFGIDPDTGEYDRGLERGGFALVAGAHRIEAARRLGWGRIEAFVLDDPSPDMLALVEVDENLVRAELTPLDRGRFVARREELRRKLHPKSRQGGDHKSAEYREKSKTEKLGFCFSPPSSIEETVDLTGLSKGTVERALRIGKHILPELQDALEDTPIAHREGDLYRLAGLPEAEQRRALERLREADEPPERLSELVRKTDAPPSTPREPTPAQRFGKLESAWAYIPRHHQVTALHRLCLLIDAQQRSALVEALRTGLGPGALPRHEDTDPT